MRLVGVRNAVPPAEANSTTDRITASALSSSNAGQGRQTPPGSIICASMAVAKTAISRRDRNSQGFFGPTCLSGAPAKMWRVGNMDASLRQAF
jgi:hypothetical protein